MITTRGFKKKKKLKLYMKSDHIFFFFFSMNLNGSREIGEEIFPITNFNHFTYLQSYNDNTDRQTDRPIDPYFLLVYNNNNNKKEWLFLFFCFAFLIFLIFSFCSI